MNCVKTFFLLSRCALCYFSKNRATKQPFYIQSSTPIRIGTRLYSKEGTASGTLFFGHLVLPWNMVTIHSSFLLICTLFLKNKIKLHASGVAHADELLYMFNFPTYTNNATEAILSRRMLDVWTTFAKYG